MADAGFAAAIEKIIRGLKWEEEIFAGLQILKKYKSLHQ